jgi:hypothetical protein
MEKQQRSSIDKLESFKLMNFIQSTYAESNMNDPEFAVLATEKLRFYISASAVQGRRSDLGIPPYRLAVSKNLVDGLGTGIVGKENRIKLSILWDFVAGMSPEVIRQFKEKMEERE